MVKISNKTGLANDTKITLGDGTDITKDLGVYDVNIFLTAGSVAIAVMRCYPAVIELENIDVEQMTREDLFTGHVTDDNPKAVFDRLWNYNQIVKAGFVGRIN